MLRIYNSARNFRLQNIVCTFIATITPLGLFFTEKINFAIYTLRIVAWMTKKNTFTWVKQQTGLERGLKLPVQQELGAR